MYADIGSVNCEPCCSDNSACVCERGRCSKPPALIPPGDSQLRLSHGWNLWQDDSYSFKTAAAESGIQQSESTVKFVVCVLLCTSNWKEFLPRLILHSRYLPYNLYISYRKINHSGALLHAMIYCLHLYNSNMSRTITLIQAAIQSM
jgi:hypothetical protein